MYKMEKLLFLGLVLIVSLTAGEKQPQNVIYRLSDEDYSRMPPKNNLDRYTHCLRKPGGVYCTAYADVVSDQPSELLDMMKGYSAHKVKHMNYTEQVHGVCLTDFCQEYYNGSDDEAHLRLATEACINRTLSAQYGLKTKITRMNCYFEKKKGTDVDWLDALVATLLAAVLALNIGSTVYDTYRDRTKPGMPVLLAFSLLSNWKQLVTPPTTDPKTERLRSLNGIRALTSLLVILGHTPLSLIIAIDNPSWIENAYDVPPYHILAHGHMITLSFFLISGFLLVYNTQIMAEKNRLTLSMVPGAIINRWLRLSPINLLSLLLTATAMKHTARGPFWDVMIGDEVSDCRNYWYYNLFYVNNFVDHSQCILQSWYLACDMQLHIVGLLVVALATSARARKWTLGVLYCLGFALPAYFIYTMDLDATLLASPTTMSQFFLTDLTFNWVYKRTYANLPLFVIGMAFGYVIYDWQTKNVFQKDFSKYRHLYYLLTPGFMFVIWSTGYFFCGDGPRASMALRLIFRPIAKPLFVTLIMFIIIGAMFRIEKIQRGILEWGGWMPLSRISYCVYAFHVSVVRYLGGTRPSLMHFSVLHLVHDHAGVTVLTLQFALIFYLFVEAPFAQLQRLYFAKKKPEVKSADNCTALNGAAVTGTSVNGAAITGTSVNGAAVNRAAVNGTAVNGIALNGAALNGTALNGTAVSTKTNGAGVTGIPVEFTRNNASINGNALNGHTHNEIPNSLKDKDA